MKKKKVLDFIDKGFMFINISGSLYNQSFPTLNDHELSGNLSEKPEIHMVKNVEPLVTISKSILFVFTACLVGAFIRQMLKGYHVPYTVIIFIIGALMGIADAYSKEARTYTEIADIDPRTLMQLFLPVLIFESAFGTDAHMFFRAVPQCIMLALPGLLICMMFTAIYAKYAMVSYKWSWTLSMLFADVISATDPVAVVAILKECGIAPSLTTIMEGESLMNDGAAIVIFDVLWRSTTTEQSSTGTIVFFFFKTIIGAPIFGCLMGLAFTWTLSRIYNDSVVEITITYAGAYVTYYIADEIFAISGVLTVVFLAITMSNHKSCISPEVEPSVHHFWEILSYIANTLIFMIVGIIITFKVVKNSTRHDILHVISTYVVVNIFRGVMVVMLSPILRNIGYGLPWKHAVVLTWGGLRGAVSIALSLILTEVREFGYDATDKLLIQVSGIVVLTLVINATTMTPLLNVLGMNDVSHSQYIAMGHAVAHLRSVAMRSERVQKLDKYMANADWLWVRNYTKIENPYSWKDNVNPDLYSQIVPSRTGKCECCAADVSVEPNETEMADMKEESRLRVLRMLKASVWKQHEHGLITRRTLKHLCSAIDDTADVHGRYVTTSYVKEAFMKVHPFVLYLIEKFSRYLSKFESGFRTNQANHELKCQEFKGLRKTCVAIYLSSMFEFIINIVIIINMAVTIYHDTKLSYSIFGSIRRYLWYWCHLGFVIFYLCETAIKLIALGLRRYFTSHWNKFDFLITFTVIVDLVVDWLLELTTVNHDALAYLRLIIIIRLLRLYKFWKVCVKSVLRCLRNQMSSRLYNVYDVGPCFIEAQEEVLKNLSFIVDFAPIAYSVQQVLEKNIVEMVTYLDEIESRSPSITVALKSHRAARRILNDIMKALSELNKDSLVAVEEAELLSYSISMMMKAVIDAPRSVRVASEDVNDILKNIGWIKNEELQNVIYTEYSVDNYEIGELIRTLNQEPTQISIISKGVVRVAGEHDETEEKPSSLPNTDSLLYFVAKGRFHEFLTSSRSLGLLGYLEKTPCVTSAICETKCQVMQISYETLQKCENTFKDLSYLMWRQIALRISALLMETRPKYMDRSEGDIKLLLETAILPDLDNAEHFEKDASIDDMILIQGKARDPDQAIVYTGPVYLADTVRRLEFREDPKYRPRIVMVLLSNEKYITQYTENWLKLEDMGYKGLCLMHATRRKSSMFPEAKAVKHRRSPSIQFHDVRPSDESTVLLDSPDVDNV